jgi:hypothetical protein
MEFNINVSDNINHIIPSAEHLILTKCQNISSFTGCGLLGLLLTVNILGLVFNART